MSNIQLTYSHIIPLTLWPKITEQLLVHNTYTNAKYLCFITGIGIYLHIYECYREQFYRCHS